MTHEATTTTRTGAATEEMADLVVPVAGRELPSDYRYALWVALCDLMPWLAEEPRAGVLGIRSVATERGVALLSRRAHLTLRLPVRRLADAANALERAALDVAGETLRLGTGHVRALPVAGTLYADFVTTGSTDEVRFREDVAAGLERLGVTARIICGRERRLEAEGRTVSGYALALHDLKPDGAVTLLCEGLGTRRELGCGIFVQHKAITGLA